MTYNLQSVLLALMVWLLVDYLASACDIDTIRSRTDGWDGVAVDDRGVVELKQTVVDDNIVAKAYHVIESYSQVNHVTLVIQYNTILFY